MAERLAADRGLPYAMDDTDSMFFVRPAGMPRERFNELADEISGVHGVFQRLNPYDPIEGEEEPFFGIEKISYGLGTKTLKPTYILSIAAKRYGIANIVRADGSDYADAAEAARDKAAHVILRKATGRRWLDINDLMLLRHEEFRREHRYELPGIISMSACPRENGGAAIILSTRPPGNASVCRGLKYVAPTADSISCSIAGPRANTI